MNIREKRSDYTSPCCSLYCVTSYSVIAASFSGTSGAYDDGDYGSGAGGYEDENL